MESKTAATSDDLGRAEQIGVELIQALGARELVRRREATHGEGLRAITLLVRAYDEVRAAVAYLRWKERDADEIAPSLYSGRRRRIEAEEEEEPIEPVAEPTVATPPVPPSPTAPAVP